MSFQNPEQIDQSEESISSEEALLLSWFEQTTHSGSVLPVRPEVTLSYAQSLDGSITAFRGRPTGLSGDEAYRAAHIIRSCHDGILVGIGTVLSDDPRLSVRLAEGPDPRPVVLDAELRTPLSSRVLSGNRRALIFCRDEASAVAERRLGDAGAVIFRVPCSSEGFLELNDVLGKLRKEGISRLMVEGGGEVLTTFLSSDLWDRAAITLVPRWMGGYGPPLPPGLRAGLSRVLWIPAGEDVLCLGRRKI